MPNYTAQDLINLSERLSTAAEKCNCPLKADQARYYVEVCKHFAKHFKAKERANAWQPPTLEEVLTFCGADETCREWPKEDLLAWFDHFESNGWKVSGTTKMSDWKAAARNGARRWKKEQARFAPQKPAVSAVVAAAMPKPDPTGWASFLSEVLKQDYVRYQYAQEWMKREYRKSI